MDGMGYEYPKRKTANQQISSMKVPLAKSVGDVQLICSKAELQELWDVSDAVSPVLMLGLSTNGHPVVVVFPWGHDMMQEEKTSTGWHSTS